MPLVFDPQKLNIKLRYPIRDPYSGLKLWINATTDYKAANRPTACDPVLNPDNVVGDLSKGIQTSPDVFQFDHDETFVAPLLAEKVNAPPVADANHLSTRCP